MSSAIEIEIDENYQRGKIYKLVDRTNGNIYIGSTISSLSHRLSQHKYDYKRKENGEISNFITSFDIIENDDYYIELIEDYPCNCKYELELRERFHIEHNICINKCIPTRTRKEYRKINKKQIALKKKEYAKNHKEQIALYKEEYYQNNKEEIALKTKEYAKNHKEEIKIRQSLKYQKNKEQIALKNKELILCEICNFHITKRNFVRHLKSQKHIININNLIK